MASFFDDFQNVPDFMEPSMEANFVDLCPEFNAFGAYGMSQLQPSAPPQMVIMNQHVKVEPSAPEYQRAMSDPLAYQQQSQLLDAGPSVQWSTPPPVKSHARLIATKSAIADVAQSEYEPSLALYKDILMKLVNQEITQMCRKLDVDKDPYFWTSLQVRSWLFETIKQRQLPLINLDNFDVEGAIFSTFTLADFLQRAPECGEQLYACLQIWLAAREQENSNRVNAKASDFGSQPAPASDDNSGWLVENLNPSIPSPIDSGNSGSMSSCLAPLNIPSMAAHFDGPTPSAVLGHVTLPSPQSDSSSESGYLTSGEGDEAARQATKSGRHGKSAVAHIHLWQFIRELLDDVDNYAQCVRWLNRDEGIFKIEDSVRMAKLWGERKNRPAMNYDKLSRSLRQYYRKRILQKTTRSQRLVYQFCHPYHM